MQVPHATRSAAWVNVQLPEPVRRWQCQRQPSIQYDTTGHFVCLCRRCPGALCIVTLRVDIIAGTYRLVQSNDDHRVSPGLAAAYGEVGSPTPSASSAAILSHVWTVYDVAVAVRCSPSAATAHIQVAPRRDCRCAAGCQWRWRSHPVGRFRALLAAHLTWSARHGLCALCVACDQGCVGRGGVLAAQASPPPPPTAARQGPYGSKSSRRPTFSFCRMCAPCMMSQSPCAALLAPQQPTFKLLPAATAAALGGAGAPTLSAASGRCLQRVPPSLLGMVCAHCALRATSGWGATVSGMLASTVTGTPVAASATGRAETHLQLEAYAAHLWHTSK